MLRCAGPLSRVDPQHEGSCDRRRGASQPGRLAALAASARATRCRVDRVHRHAAHQGRQATVNAPPGFSGTSSTRTPCGTPSSTAPRWRSGTSSGVPKRSSSTEWSSTPNTRRRSAEPGRTVKLASSGSSPLRRDPRVRGPDRRKGPRHAAPLGRAVLPNGFKAQVAAARGWRRFATAKRSAEHGMNSSRNWPPTGPRCVTIRRRPRPSRPRFLNAALPFLPLFRIVDFVPVISAGQTRDPDTGKSARTRPSGHGGQRTAPARPHRRVQAAAARS